MRPWLEGRTPARRANHAMELAAIVMSRTSCSEVVFCLGGLAAVKSYVNRIGIVQLTKPGCVNRRLCGGCGGGLGQHKTTRLAETPTLRRQMHATLQDDRAGRMTQESGCWREGARNKRRLGTLSGEGGGGDSWVGFAGL